VAALERGILRLAHKTVEPAGRARYSVSPLAAGEEWELEEYTVRLDSLIMQPLGTPDVGRYRGPIQAAPQPWRRYCKWHSGPLDSRDEPWRRIYCTAPVEGRYEYCRQHRRSERFLYDLCMGLRGSQALEACRELDSRVRTEYAVYLLVQQGGHVKVGSTRRFRVLERIAEQPHAAATLLAVYDSALGARRAEMAVSRAGIASEHRPRGRRARLPAPGPAAAALASAAEAAARLLGVEWYGRILRVKPPSQPPARPLDRPPTAAVRVAGYWGGMLLAEAGGSTVWIDERSLLHADSLLYDHRLLRLGQ
jgi:hypothetical protein